MVVRGGVSHRNKTDMAIEILELANGGGVTRYQMSYKVFLNYSQIKEIVPMLIEDGLLCYESATSKTMGTFRTTGKGLAFLQAYHQMNEMLNICPDY
jgi:predicted transcriptional regulator